jgi:signal transduction histidine kinase
MTDKARKWLERLLRSLELPAPEMAHRLRRILAIERNLVLPIKAVAVGIILYSFRVSPWFGLPLGSFEITVTTLNAIFAAYLAANLAGAAVLLFARRLPLPLVQWAVFAISLTDGIFVGALTLVSGGYDSLLFWMFLVLIVRNAASTPPVWSQLALNFCIGGCFAVAGFLDISLTEQVTEELSFGAGVNSFSAQGGESAAEAILIRLIVLILAGVWLYAVEVLLEKQRLAADEAREFNARENQLRSAGRLAAEFAHQIKNPLAIINNAAFSLQRGLKTGKGDPQQQLGIITEEVGRADRIITQVMGYAELTEGRVEKLDLVAEIERAVAQTFPAGLAPGVNVQLDLHGPFPPMLMQRRHLAEVFLNILQNAREALGGSGNVTVSARVRRDLAVEAVIADDGPGIPREKLDQIFEAYFTTKQRGTGLGLAIVKNNLELYGGSVRAESELGKGVRFTLVFPAKSSVKLGS